MAGMGDNPLVGEYTKGISKGGDYFAKLDLRCKREKFDAQSIVNDLEMGLMRDMVKFQKSIPVPSHLDRFACVGASSNVSKASIVKSLPLVKHTVVARSFADLKAALSRPMSA